MFLMCMDKHAVCPRPKHKKINTEKVTNGKDRYNIDVRIEKNGRKLGLRSYPRDQKHFSHWFSVHLKRNYSLYRFLRNQAWSQIMKLKMTHCKK